MYDPPPSDFSGYEFTASARPAQPADHAIARASLQKTQRTLSRRKRPRRSKKVLFACGLSSGARRLRPSIRPTFAMHCVMRLLLHWWPQQARRRLPLSGGLTRDRSRLVAADERADRPRQGRVVCSESTCSPCTLALDGEQKIGVVLICTHARLHAAQRVHGSSDYPCALAVCVRTAVAVACGCTWASLYLPVNIRI